MNVAHPIEWTGKGVVMLDQRRLPNEVIRHTYTDYRDVAAAMFVMFSSVWEATCPRFSPVTMASAPSFFIRREATSCMNRLQITQRSRGGTRVWSIRS